METLESFYKEYSKRAYHAALKVLRDPDIAQDIMQDTMLKAWGKRHQCINKDYATWISTISSNASKAYLKSNETSSGNKFEYLEHEHFSDDYTESCVMMEEKITMLKRLPSLILEIFFLHVLEGCSYDAVSNLLNITKPEVWRALYIVEQILNN